MTKKERFSVVVAAFEALLKNNQLWDDYFIHFQSSKSYRISDEIFTNWKDWAIDVPPYQWCSGAFVWGRTPHGYSIWRDFDYEWLKWICKNLNK